MDTPNYGTLRMHPFDGLPYITDAATGKKLYKHPPCRICGMAPWFFDAQEHDTCGVCKPERAESNDNDEPDA